MKSNFNSQVRIRFAILVSAILLPVGATAFGQTTYTVIDLGVDVTPSDINENGDVVGSLITEQNVTAGFYFDAVNGLSVLPGTRRATAINDQHEIVGSTIDGGSFLISGGSFIDFGIDHTASGINEVGQVAGSQSKDNPYRSTPRPTDAAIYDIPSGQWTALDVARVYPRGRQQGVYADLYRLTDINDSGLAVGTKSRYGLYGSSSSFLLLPGSDSVTWLPIPGGGEANAINGLDQVVGRTGVIGGTYTGYFYDIASGTLVDLGTLSGGTYSLAYDINDHGQIVGTSSNLGFIWQDGVMTDLNTRLDANSPWLITGASAINERGDIAAVGLLSGEMHGVVLINNRCTAPTAYSIFRGVEVSGTLGDFAASDDVKARYNPGVVISSTEAPVWLIFDSIDAPATTAILVESSAGTPGLQYTVETSSDGGATYAVIGTQAETYNVDSTVTFPFSGSADRIRIGWRKVGFTINFPWEVRIDQVGFCH